MGIEAASEMMPEIEIEIEDPESVLIGVDGMPILEISKDDEDENEFNKNLAEDMDDRELATIAGDLTGLFEDDVSARRDWVETYSDGLKLLGLRLEEKSEPWEGASCVQPRDLRQNLRVVHIRSASASTARRCDRDRYDPLVTKRFDGSGN